MVTRRLFVHLARTFSSSQPISRPVSKPLVLVDRLWRPGLPAMRYMHGYDNERPGARSGLWWRLPAGLPDVHRYDSKWPGSVGDLTRRHLVFLRLSVYFAAAYLATSFAVWTQRLRLSLAYSAAHHRQVDCGGPICPACPGAGGCTDGIMNGAMTPVGQDINRRRNPFQHRAFVPLFEILQNKCFSVVHAENWPFGAGDETLIDCGGSCTTCGNCVDHIMNGAHPLRLHIHSIRVHLSRCIM